MKAYLAKYPLNSTKKALFFIKRSLSTNDLVKINFEDGVKRITMSNPKTRNALSLGMMKELIDHINSDQNNQNLRVIVLSAERPVFSAGHNLKELNATSGRHQHEKVFQTSSTLMSSIIESSVPVIARVDGLAAAAGCQLVAQCDLAICSERSSFSTPGANFGIFCSTPGISIARCVSKMAAMNMLLTGLPVASSEAKQIGLVAKVSPDQRLDEDLVAICKAIMTKSRSVIELGKRFYYKQIREDVMDAYKMGANVMVDNLGLKDGQEGINSFIEKRKATWNHSFEKHPM